MLHPADQQTLIGDTFGLIGRSTATERHARMSSVGDYGIHTAVTGFNGTLSVKKRAMTGRRFLAFAAAAALGGFLSISAPTSADNGQGRDLYLQLCSKCHGRITEQDSALHMGGVVWPAVMMIQGPNLSGIVGRPAGQAVDYRYSMAFRKAAPGLIWTEANLERWIANSRAMMPGTFMLLRVRDGRDRNTIIDYLKAYARHRPK